MIEITVCHAPADTAAAEGVRARLEQCAEARVTLEPLKTGETLPDIWDRGSSAHGLLLMLSPESVPARGGREAWGEVLEHVESNEAPSIATAVVNECACPPLLRRRNSFRISELAGVRGLQLWALALHEAAGEPSFVPADPGIDAAAQVDELMRALADGGGTRQVEDPLVAQSFARSARSYFRDTLWISCGERSPVFVAAELADGLGVRQEEANLETLSRVLSEHRVLVVFDDVRGPVPAEAPKNGRGAVLIVSGSPGRRTSGQHAVDAALRLWQAMSVCTTNRVPVEFAGRVAGLDQASTTTAVRELRACGVACALDERRGIERLIERFPAPMAEMVERHAGVLIERYRTWRRDAGESKLLLPEAELAWRRREEIGWDSAAELGERVLSYLQGAFRGPEAEQMLVWLRDESQARGDERRAAAFEHELSWLGGFALAPKSAAAAEQMRLPFAS